MARSTYYYKPVEQGKNKGRKPSQITMTEQGNYVSNDQVLEDIIELLRHEFVDYGYLKITYWLRKQGYIINKKKVYRLMKKHDLLLDRKKRRHGRKNWVKELVPQPKTYFEYLEIDIKNIYIHNHTDNALVVSIIDVDSRWVLGQYVGTKIKNDDIIVLFDKVFNYYGLPRSVYIRSDNGGQFIADLTRQFLLKAKVVQEFTKPATPQQNAHIEAYHSILESVICQRFEFDDLDEVRKTFNRFIIFYNFDRIHSGIKYQSPADYLKQKGLVFQLNNKLENILNCTHIFSRKLPKIKEEYKIGKFA